MTSLNIRNAISKVDRTDSFFASSFISSPIWLSLRSSHRNDLRPEYKYRSFNQCCFRNIGLNVRTFVRLKVARMWKKVLKIGTKSRGVILPLPLCKVLGIDLGTKLRVSIDQGRIVLDRRATDRDPMKDAA